MESTTEIRLLPIDILSNLIVELEVDGAWQKLVRVIPKKLNSDIPNNFKSDITIDNPAKYPVSFLRLARSLSIESNISCSEILLDNWTVNGRPRVTLGHLKYLLTKAELFRQADFIAELLDEAPVPRPSNRREAGFPLPIHIPPSSEIERINDDVANIDRHPNGGSYPQRETEKINYNRTPSEGIPEVNIMTEAEDVSDLMKFSKKSIPDSIVESTSSYSAVLIPDFSKIVPDVKSNSTIISIESSETISSDSESEFIPEAVAELNKSSFRSNEYVDSNIPLTIPQPLISAAASVLVPNFLLNTELPHFPYAEIEKTTKYFSSVEDDGLILGSGGFGLVFLAIGLLDEQSVAVKKMTTLFHDASSDGHEEDLVIQQFKNEVDILGQYKHKNLISLLGYSCDGPAYCLIYEYVPGGSLFDELQKSPKKLSWQQRIFVALGTAEAVAYLHTNNLVHRDIKTSNILLDVENQPKLCDFGIAKILSSQTSEFESAPCGTSPYMAPEHLLHGEISIKIDVFSFGVVLFELLTSLPPVLYERDPSDLISFIEENCEESIEAMLDKTVGSWQKNDENFSEEIYKLAQLCLRPKKEQRIIIEDVVNILKEIRILNNVTIMDISDITYMRNCAPR